LGEVSAGTNVAVASPVETDGAAGESEFSRGISASYRDVQQLSIAPGTFALKNISKKHAESDLLEIGGARPISCW